MGTPSGRIELASKDYAKTGFSSVPEWRGQHQDDQYPLRLVSPHPRFRVHSQGSNLAWVRAAEKHELLLNVQDAAARGVRDGSLVLVRSESGTMRIAARVTDGIMPGVACLHQGIWPDIGPDGVDTAGAANMLTSTEPTMPSRGSRTHSTRVEIDSIKEGE